MMEKKCAEEIKELALKSIKALSEILLSSQGRCSEDEYERVKKGVGLSIGKIETDILTVIYESYPELDNLN